MTQFTSGPFRRFGVRFGIAVAAISMVCGGATQFAVAGPKSVAIAVQSVASISETPTTVGVADSALYFETPEQIEETLDALQAMGVQNVRIQIPWAGVQLLGPNSYLWQYVDNEVNAAYARNMGVLAEINATPWWAGSPPINGQPNSPEAYATFVGKVAERYEGKIAAYEVWNEPNAKFFFDPVDPAAYTDLLKVAYPAIKQADPSALVIGAVVGSTLTIGQITMNPVDFVAGMYAAGAHGYFDALSFHPYHYTLPFSEGADVPQSPMRQLMAIRQLMDLNGDGGLKVWATEYGEPASEGGVQQQADFTEDFLNSWHTVDGTGPMFIYTTKDINSASTKPSETLGLFYDTGQPKPAAAIVAEFLGAQPPGAIPSRPILAAIKAVAYALAQITRNVAGLFVDAIRFAVNATVSVIRGLVDFTVGLIQAGAQLVRDFVDRITDRPPPPATAVTALSSTAAVRATQPAVDAIDPPAQRSSVKVARVAAVDTAEAGTSGVAETSITGKSGDVPERVVIAESTASPEPTTAAEPTKSTKPTTAAEPTTSAESATAAKPTTSLKAPDEPDPSTPDATPSKPATKPSAAAATGALGDS
ncbi:cellulase family glycosylhydrolase [Mycobacterium sp. URHB0044]|uniref:cellulase family glycosylhydrolase n=1 Tax=Mycobacterium sp. URHB0044 TaxID=1380386 RepID=UPI0009DD722E|nr:cellulase family glycosylhydrolase [Mycobacterium sp. URHB0044]